MYILKIFGLALLVIAVAIGALFLGARFNDGPIGPFTGGALVSGGWADKPVSDWGPVVAPAEVALQLATQDRSRTVWIFAKDGAAYVPCSVGFPPGKSWHLRAQEDGRAVLRVADRRYPVTLERVPQAEVAALHDAMRAKYEGGPGGETWLFRVKSRPREARERALGHS